jgi:uroporphyrinogen-III synthase
MMRVLVGRPQDDAERTAAALAARGHEAVIAPVLHIATTNEAPPAGTFDGIVVTSANAVPALASRRRLFAEASLFAVGQRTAAALREAGLGDAVTAEGDARSLSALIRRSAPTGARLLHVAARDRKAEPRASLAAAGFRVETWTAYEALAVPHLPVVALCALREGRLDAALHYSRRSAEILIRLADEADVTARLRALANVCLSADVAAPLEAAGANVAVAARPDETALLAVLDEVAEKSGQAGSRTTRPG